MRFSKNIRLGLIGVTVAAMLCGCRGNIPMEEALDNSETMDMMSTVEEENETTKEITGELLDSSSSEQTTTSESQEASDEVTTKESSGDDVTVDTTTAESTTEKQTTLKPTTSKPTTSKPTTSKPTTAKPTTSKPTASKPTTTKKQVDTADQETTTQKATEENTETPQPVVYSVTVKNQAGMQFSDITVNVYADNTCKTLKGSAITDSYGTVEFTLNKSNQYRITLGNVPKEYKVASTYSFDGTNAVITLTTAVIKEPLPSSLKEGDIMYDITVTDPSGKTYTLSEILEKKNMVMLNFWYANCGACKMEFPYINDAYLKYKDDIEVLAVNPYDSMSSIDYVQSNYGLKFPMVSCDIQLAKTFGVSGYPTTVIIDKYGVILMVELGARVEAEYWEELFGAFAE